MSVRRLTLFPPPTRRIAMPIPTMKKKRTPNGFAEINEEFRRQSRDLRRPAVETVDARKCVVAWDHEGSVEVGRRMWRHTDWADRYLYSGSGQFKVFQSDSNGIILGKILALFVELVTVHKIDPAKVREEFMKINQFRSNMERWV